MFCDRRHGIELADSLDQPAGEEGQAAEGLRISRASSTEMKASRPPAAGGDPGEPEPQSRCCWAAQKAVQQLAFLAFRLGVRRLLKRGTGLGCSQSGQGLGGRHADG